MLGVLARAMQRVSVVLDKAAELDDKHEVQAQLVGTLGRTYHQACGAILAAEQSIGTWRETVKGAYSSARSTAEDLWSRTENTSSLLLQQARGTLEATLAALDDLSSRSTGVHFLDESNRLVTDARTRVAQALEAWSDVPTSEIPVVLTLDALMHARTAIRHVSDRVHGEAASVYAQLPVASQEALAAAQARANEAVVEALGRVQQIRRQLVDWGRARLGDAVQTVQQLSSSAEDVVVDRAVRLDRAWKLSERWSEFDRRHNAAQQAVKLARDAREQGMEWRRRAEEVCGGIPWRMGEGAIGAAVTCDHYVCCAAGSRSGRAATRLTVWLWSYATHLHDRFWQARFGDEDQEGRAFEKGDNEEEEDEDEDEGQDGDVHATTMPGSEERKVSGKGKGKARKRRGGPPRPQS